MRQCAGQVILIGIGCSVMNLFTISTMSANDWTPNQVIIRFEHGAVTPPDSGGGPYPIPGEITFAPVQLGDSLEAACGIDLTPLGRGLHGVGEGSGLLDLSDLYLLTCPDSIDIPAFIQQIRSLPGVADAEPSYVGCLAWEPDDSLYATMQWYLENTGQMGGLPDVDIDVAGAWDSVPTGGNIPVYVVDSGVGPHEDVAVSGYVNKTISADNGDETGHGTAVAGIIGGDCNNDALGIAGINCHRGEGQHAPIFSVKITSELTIDDAIAVKGVNYCASVGARIVNCSWGYPQASFSMAAAIKNLYAHGALIVCSSGNGGGGPHDCFSGPGVWPAAFSKSTFAVGAIVRGGQIWGGSLGGDYVDISAPGGAGIVAPLRNGKSNKLGYWGIPPNDVDPGFFGGTSAAAPMVSGVAALLLGADSTLTNDDLANILTRTAIAVDPGGWDRRFGWGKVNAERAVRFVSGPTRQLVHGTISKQNIEIADSSDLYEKRFKNMKWCFGDSRFSDYESWYLVKRYKLQGQVSLGPPYLSNVRNIWVRHKTGSGLYPGWPDDDPMDCVLEVGWGAIDSTSWSSTSATLYTYTYALYETQDTSFVGFYPVHPDSVEIPYTVILGPFDDAPTVEIIHPNGGEDWGCGIPGGNQNRDVEWIALDDDGVDSVTIYWSLDSGMTWPFVLTSAQDNDSSWTWAVGSADTCSIHSRVAILAHDGWLERNYDISEEDFTGGGPIEGQMGDEMRPRPVGRAKPECYAGTDATIFFSVPDPAIVTLRIYDVRGRLVRSLMGSEKLAGTHQARWDLRQEDGVRVSAGVYFYRFTAGVYTDTGKITVLR